MARFFLSRASMRLEEGLIPIVGDDAHHIAYSLRMAVGDPITVCDMQKTEYLCTILSVKPDEVLLSVNDTRENDTELPIKIHLYQSLPKGDKMEYIIQKAVELGAASVTPVTSARCIVKLDEKSAEKKIARWQKIAEEAAKQCGRGYIPEVRAPISFPCAIEAGQKTDLPLFCYEGDDTVSLKTVLGHTMDRLLSLDHLPEAAVYIGPEGGYDRAEVDKAASAGMTAINLGKRILRCETASGFVLAAMTYAFEL
ncbi:MAG: 16S rRNA (uracil(1498)-N(3))-methyltransferase [Clostridia bacterium]|nr:16S rRNA (uracil(1498)-N(3))-methyltransferase [Clostridia bacterium]